MSANLRKPERILCTVDVSSNSRAAVTRIVDLARHFGAHLDVVFVEDDTLFDMVEHPLLGYVDMPGGRQGRLDRPRLEREYRRAGERTRALLERTARARNVRWSFRVSRSAVDREAAETGRDSDLVVLGSLVNPLGGSVHRSRLLSQISRFCGRSTLLMREGPPVRAPAIALYRAGADLDSMAAVLVSFVAPGETTVILEEREAGPGEEEDPGRWEAVRERLRRERIRFDRRRIGADTVRETGEMAKLLRAGIVVIPADLFSDTEIDRITSVVPSEVLLLR